MFIVLRLVFLEGLLPFSLRGRGSQNARDKLTSKYLRMFSYTKDTFTICTCITPRVLSQVPEEKSCFIFILILCLCRSFEASFTVI